MKSASKIAVVIIVLLSSLGSFAQIKNKKTETVKINGNCGMCKATIEKAGNQKNIASVNWDKNTKLAIISYNSKKTNQDEILKRIALAGYDNEKFRAPNETYEKLPGCCQYDRELKTDLSSKETEKNNSPGIHNHAASTSAEASFKSIFDSYFMVKDALIKANGTLASAKSAELINAIKAIDMNKLSAAEHTVWMEVIKDLAFDAEHISETKDVAHQRDHFASLSANVYKLIKTAKPETPIYYQNCPMYNNGKGANWLSKENVIKNPYYGAQMLSCGSTIETLK